MKRYLFIILVLLISFSSTYAGEGKVIVYAFGDIYYVASSNDRSLEGLTGMRFRRVYLGYDYKINDTFSSLIQLEMNDPGFKKNADGTVAVPATLQPFLKDLYLKWAATEKMNVILGLSASPTWELIENFWAYRSVEKSFLNLHGFGSARDTGIAFKGSFDAEKKFGYHFMVGNGNGASSEDNNNGDKKIMLALYAKPIQSLVIELYGDYENNEKPTTSSGNPVITYQGFVGYEREGGWSRLGLQVARHLQGQGKDTVDKRVTGYSLFGFATIGKNLKVLGRVDFVDDPDRLAGGDAYIPMSKNEDKTMGLVGLDYEVEKGINFIPNVEWVNYANKSNSNLDDDLQVRLTIAFKWQ